jgi:hypothetical protein
MECKFIVNFLKVTSKKLTIKEHTMHGRLKELVAGPSNKGPEKWWAMVVIALATLAAFVHQDVYNEIAKAFTEEEPNVVNKEKKKGINQGRKMEQYT